MQNQQAAEAYQLFSIRYIKRMWAFAVLLLIISESTFAQDSLYNECNTLQKGMPSLAHEENYPVVYDSARYIIEHCATINGLVPQVYGDFGVATTANQYRNSDNHRFTDYREWLKKVLYYNSDSFYYCQDVSAILSTFLYFNDSRGYDQNGQLAVFQFLRDSNRCLSIIPDEWDMIRKEQYKIWRDSVDGDPRGRGPDSTLP